MPAPRNALSRLTDKSGSLDYDPSWGEVIRRLPGAVEKKARNALSGVPGALADALTGGPFRRNWERLSAADQQGIPAADALDYGDLLSTAFIPGNVLGTQGKSLFAAKRSVGYDPLPVPQRSFHDDYPQNARSDGSGRLAQTIEGEQLNAPFVAGRRRVGADDEGLGKTSVAQIAEALAGTVRPASGRELGGYAGRYRHGTNSEIAYDQSLPSGQQLRVIAHETGHAVDEIAGQVPTAGLADELRVVYSDLATGQQGRTRNLTEPKHMGYSTAEAPREMMAEAIRAYMIDPNYLKSVAPKTAARIREHINTNPRVSRVVQFNTLAPIGGQPSSDAQP